MAKKNTKVLYSILKEVNLQGNTKMIIQITAGSSDLYIQAKSISILNLLDNSMMSMLLEYDGKKVLQFNNDAQRDTALTSIIAAGTLTQITCTTGTIYVNANLVQTIDLLANNAMHLFLMDFGDYTIQFDSSLQRTTALNAIIAAS